MDFIYLYGMVMSTESILLKWDFPKPDGYGEIENRIYGLGGETGTAAAILRSLGCFTRLGGSHLGHRNNKLIHDYFGENADLSELVYDEDFAGVEDMVIIDKNTRTVFGRFAALFSGKLDWVEPPSEEAVKNCSVVGCDPFFGDEIARLCVKHGKPYAVIDTMHDDFMNKNCAVNAISHQHIKEKYPDLTFEQAHKLYTDNTDGLVIFTCGEGKMLYGRRGEKPKAFGAYTVDVQSTLGAGDSFKAGTIYGLYKGLDDDELVRFAAATAAFSCAHFPIWRYPAKVEDVLEIIKADKHYNTES